MSLVKTLTKLSAFLVGTLMLLAAFSPAVALSSLITAPGMCVESVNGSSYYSSNWSGYAVTGSAGSVTSPSGSWTVPAVTGSRFTTAYAAFWVGIDGFASNTVEQTAPFLKSLMEERLTTLGMSFIQTQCTR